MNKEPTVHQMNVHLFGATSSPSCAQFGLLQSAKDQAEEFSEPVRNLVRSNFYMEDCLFSVPSADEGIRLIREVSSLLRNRGFNLTKWCSNSQSILKSVLEEKSAKSGVELKDDQGSYERVLGVQWNLSEDLFRFQVRLKNKPVTRRGILSALSSLFDPLGFVAPIILTARLILQDLCRLKLGWDEGILEEDARKWRSWLGDLTNLSQVTIPRCVVRAGIQYSTLEKRELHHFTDASSVGYSTVSY